MTAPRSLRQGKNQQNLAKRFKIAIVLAIPFTFVVLFCVNGLVLNDGETARLGVAEAVDPVAGAASDSPASDSPAPTTDTDLAVAPRDPTQVRVLAFNIAKAHVHLGGMKFADDADVRTRLDAMAALIREADPDIVCLSEVVRELGRSEIDQTEYLAARSGLPHWAFGEYVSFGLPFYRYVGGTAILSRYPLRDGENRTLVGRKPFFVTKNNRRAVIAIAELPAGPVKVWSLHLDSFDFATNEAQMKQILDDPGSSTAILAGDFNAQPTSPTMKLVADSGRFNGVIDSAPTFPSENPTRAIDFILAPATWAIVEHRIIATHTSDHCAVLTVFARTANAAMIDDAGAGLATAATASDSVVAPLAADPPVVPIAIDPAAAVEPVPPAAP